MRRGSPNGESMRFFRRPGKIKDTPEARKQLYVISRMGRAQQITKTENDVNAFDWRRFQAHRFFDCRTRVLSHEDPKEKYGEYSCVTPITDGAFLDD